MLKIWIKNAFFLVKKNWIKKYPPYHQGRNRDKTQLRIQLSLSSLDPGAFKIFGRSKSLKLTIDDLKYNNEQSLQENQDLANYNDKLDDEIKSLAAENTKLKAENDELDKKNKGIEQNYFVTTSILLN